MSHPARLQSALAAALTLALAVTGFAAEVPGPAPASSRALALEARAARMKQVQQALLMRGARRRIAEARERAAHRGKAGARARRPRELFEGGAAGTPAGLRPLLSTRASAGPALAPNVIANDRAADPAGHVGQAEEMIAALGAHALVAWNDGIGFEPGSGSASTQGYGWSVDGGSTWTDGGIPPLLAGWRWASDPLAVVNEKTGDFFYCALVDVGADQNGIAVVRARFDGGALGWSEPVLVRVADNRQLFFDKPWMAADSLSGRLYLTYSVFTASSDTILFQRSSTSDPLHAWDAPQRLSGSAEAGYVQGSRPVVGPDGEVYVVWYSIGKPPEVRDFMRVRRSGDQGATFGSAATAAALYSNFGTGAPGFNRGTGITYPSIAVDRSAGPHRGRVYVTWNESVNFYGDELGTGTAVSEREANDTPAQAIPFALGQVVRGACGASKEQDWFRFSGTAGQTVVFYVDSLSSGLDMDLRLNCTDGVTRLAYSESGTGLSDLVVYTLPTSGTYYLWTRSPDAGTGGYRIQTGVHTVVAGERARDHRDVFVTWSDDGSTWSTPVPGSDSPAGFDDWLPEVAVAGTSTDPLIGSGRPYVAWYDWRDSPGLCGGASHVYLARSDDFGGSWATAGTVTDVQTNWSAVSSDIIPNQGDYISLFADTSNLWVAWADGRSGDPDVYTSRIALLTTAIDIALADISATRSSVRVSWYTGRHPGFTGTVTRRDSTAGTGTVALAEVTADASGFVTYVDETVIPGHRYAYALAWSENGTSYTTPEAWIEVPITSPFELTVDLALALAGQGVWVQYKLPDLRPADLALLDVTGRRVAGLRVESSPFSVRLAEGTALRPGVYFVRLTHAGRSLNRRVVVVR